MDSGLAKPHQLSCPWHGENIDDLDDDDCECRARVSADRDALRAALCAEMARVHGAQLVDPWDDSGPWEPISRPEPCECCGRVVVVIEDKKAGRAVCHLGPVVRDDGGALRVQFRRHTRDKCRAGVV
jgi:hypothetical protein